MISGVSNEELNFFHELSPFLNEQYKVNKWTALRKADESCLQQLLNDDDVDLDLIIAEIDQNFEIPDLDESTMAAPNYLEDEEIPKTTKSCLLYTSPSPRDLSTSRMPSSA